MSLINLLNFIKISSFIIVLMFSVTNSISANEIEFEKKEFQSLRNAMGKFSEIRGNWSKQLDAGISQLADACAYVGDSKKPKSNEFSLNNYIQKEKENHEKVFNELLAQTKILQKTHKNIENETCSNIFTIFGAKKEQSEKCSNIDAYSNWNQEIQTNINKWEQNVYSIFENLKKLDSLIEKQCLSLDFQSQFYQELNAFQTNLYKNELDVFSESLDFLNNVTQKIE